MTRITNQKIQVVNTS